MKWSGNGSGNWYAACLPTGLDRIFLRFLTFVLISLYYYFVRLCYSTYTVR